MRRFKTDDVLVMVLPYSRAKKLWVRQKPENAACGCTSGCTNTHPTTQAGAKVSRNDLKVLRRVLGALQTSTPRKKR